MNDLKPCPFCGNGASLEWMDGDELDLCWVECGRCGASTVFCGQPELAIDAWNTRAERTCRFVAAESVDGFEWPMPGRVECSECGSEWFPENAKSRFNYCPQCGARVEER